MTDSEEQVFSIWIGIDNGVSGSVGYILSDGTHGMFDMPCKECMNYQKQGKMIMRVDVDELKKKLQNIMAWRETTKKKISVFLERPFTMSYLTPQVSNGMRACEAVLIALEQVGLPYEFIDSKQWQYKMLGPNIKGSPQLKRASLAKGKQLWPLFDWVGVRDADSLLIAEWARSRTPF